MGGFGSGRPSGSGRDTVEACRSIDVNRLHREGCLRAGWMGGWQWTRDGEKVASINLRAEADRLHLSYRVRIGGGEWEDVAETVRIVRVPCRFGGTRPYFICPGVVNGIACGRRVAKLHGPGRYFLCRHCYRLAHASQSEGAWDRALRRANKIRQRLGGDPGMAAPFPPKPKGMWRRTYERLREQAFEAEMRADEAFALRAERLLARIDNPKTQEEILAMIETKPTLPAETGGTEITRFNALRHGVLSRYTVLPWEDAGRIQRPGRGAGGRARAAGADRGASGRGTGRHPVAQAPAAPGRGRRPPARARRHALVLPRNGEGRAGASRAAGQTERVVDAIRATAADTEDDIADMEAVPSQGIAANDSRELIRLGKQESL